MRILHTADWHLGKRLQEFSRLEEQEQVLEEIIGIAEDEEVDLVILAGDIFDSFNPSHQAIELLFRSLRRLSKNGTRPIIAIAGNHDSNQLVEAPDPLARELGILFYADYDSVIKTGKLDSGVEIRNSEEGFVELKLPKHKEPVRIILAPYANEVRLKTYLGEDDREQEFRDRMQFRWKKLADKYMDSQGINLFAGHFFFVKEGETPEKEPESERPILHVGGTQALYTSNIPEAVQYSALGHLHRYQVLGGAKGPAVYSSSPLAYSFSEADQEKKVVLVYLERDSEAEVTPIGLQKGRPLHRKRFSELKEALDWLAENPYCFVELTYATTHSIDAQTRKALFNAHDGIVNLIPEITDPSRMQQSSLHVDDLSKDMTELFEKYYESEKGISPNPELTEIFKEVIAQKSES